MGNFRFQDLLGDRVDLPRDLLESGYPPFTQVDECPKTVPEKPKEQHQHQRQDPERTVLDELVW